MSLWTPEQIAQYQAAPAVVMDAPAPSPSDHLAAQYMRALFEPGDLVCIQFIHSTDTYVPAGGTKPVPCTKSIFLTLDEATSVKSISQLTNFNDAGWHVYVCMNPLKEAGSRKKNNVAAIRTTYVEIDESGVERRSDICDDVEHGILPEPNFGLQSSPGKFQFVWLVQNMVPDQQEALNRALQIRYGGDPQSVDMVRVLRLPGFANCKPQYGKPAPIVSIESSGNKTRFTLSDFKIDISSTLRKSGPVGEPISDEKIASRIAVLEQSMTEAGFEFDFVSDPTKKDWKYKWTIQCPNAAQHTTGASTAEVFLAVDGKLGFDCFHSHCEGRDWAWFRTYLEEKVGKKIVFEVSPEAYVGPQRMPEPAMLPVDDDGETMSSTDGLTEQQIAYGVELLTAPVGPEYTDDIFYGPAGAVIKKIMPYNESHPVGMYVNLLVSFGNLIGRGAYFSVGKTRHYTNENLVCVGDSSVGRKGTGRNAIKDFVRPLDMKWKCMSGFSSPQGLISEIKDPTTYMKLDKKSGGYKDIVVPGVKDKRLLVHENEISGLFKLASEPRTRCAELVRNLWDGDEASNIVAGKTNEGATNSLVCKEPHVSISGDSTRNELKATIPVGADKNGFGNRFVYCYIFRTKIVPDGGPDVDFTEDILYFQRAIEFGRVPRFMPFASDALPTWKRWYSKTERGDDRLKGTAGNMTDRGVAHVRRLAMIIAVLDMKEQIGLEHLHAALRVWEFCKESAQFIFNGMTRAQVEIYEYVSALETVTARQIRENLFMKHRSSAWVVAQVRYLVAERYLSIDGDKISLYKKK